MKLIMQFPEDFRYFFPLRTKFARQHFVKKS